MRFSTWRANIRRSNHVQIMLMLCAFVRNPPKDDALDKPIYFEGETQPPPIREDVQAAISAIGNRSLAYIDLEARNGFRIDLHGARLRSANLRHHHFCSADFTSADLSYADLQEAILAGARLTRADLSGGTMISTNLAASVCRQAKFTRAAANNAQFHRRRPRREPVEQWRAWNALCYPIPA